MILPTDTVADIVPAPTYRWKTLQRASTYTSKTVGLFRDGLLITSYTVGSHATWVTEHSLTSSQAKRQITVLNIEKAREVCRQIAEGTFSPDAEATP